MVSSEIYAIVKSGGRQYKVVPGETIEVDRLPVEAGGRVALDDVLLIAEGDKVITRWTCRGRFVGQMFGVKGKGQPIAFTGVNIMTVRDGRIVESWVDRDALGLARQVGAMN